MESAAHLLMARGYDHVTVNALTEAANVSRGTLYGHFGEVAGVYASLWSDIGPAWLRRAFGIGLPVEAEAMEAPSSDPMVDDVCATLFVLARRVPAILEVVQPDLERMWAEVATSDMAAVRASWRLSGVLGLHLVQPVAPEAHVIRGVMDWVEAMPVDIVAGERPRELSVLGRLGPVAVEPADDDVEARLVWADMRVIGSAGYAGATMMRICRVARVSTGAAAPRFRTLLDLHRRAFEAALRSVVSTNTERATALLDDHSPSDIQAGLIVAALEPQRRMWRQYRLELLIAARHDADAAAMTRAVFDATHEGLMAELRAFEQLSAVAELVTMFNVVYSAGMAAAAEMGLPLAELDHRPATRWLFSLVQHDVGAA